MECVRLGRCGEHAIAAASATCAFGEWSFRALERCAIAERDAYSGVILSAKQ
jgi:hypothetical protein